VLFGSPVDELRIRAMVRARYGNVAPAMIEGCKP
jgi:hypothetical protein